MENMKIKKIRAFALFIAALLLTSCNNGADEPIETEIITANVILSEPDPIIESETSENAEMSENSELDGVKEYLERNFENFKIDGSTSMIPLHQFLKFKFGDGEETRHNRTVDAFEMFINGENDILLSVDFDDELLKKAADSGIKLAQKPITREAFVFLINKNNPVKNLTTEQVKGIYSGEITNWSEVGGDDAPIRAFQRNKDSGSQIRMEKFMGDTALIEKDVEYVHGMGEIIMQMANFDGGKYSIAYNMYTFTEKQYPSEEVILLALDGVSPNDDTIFDNSYPIVIYNYIYYDENDAEASEYAENLYAFLMSGEGQEFIANAGYINLNTKYDRNMNIQIERNYDDLLPIASIGFYDKEKGEFYDADGQGNLIIYDNYADFKLRYHSDYINHAGVREFLTIITNSGIDLALDPSRVTDESVIFDPSGNDYGFGSNPRTVFNLKYNDTYYSTLSYNINDNRYILKSEPESFINSLNEFNTPPGFVEYLRNNYEPGLTLEITKDELKNVYYRGSGEWDVLITENGNNFEYFRLIN